MPQELLEINTRNAVSRVLLILLLLTAGFWSYFVIRWYLGNTLAEYSDSDSSVDLARTAGSLAPNDPLPHWRLGQVYQQKLPLDQFSAAITEYEKAVSLSPNDYRFWLSLGMAHEQAGDTAKGEYALRKAVTLAPAYAYPHWYLGNLFLRDARYDEAFAELRLATEADRDLRPQLFNLVDAVYANDLESATKALGNKSDAHAEFALYLANQKKFDDSLRMWNGIDADGKSENATTGNNLVSTLVTAGRYHDAMVINNELVSDNNRAEIGKFNDPGFESNFGRGGKNIFGWQVEAAPQMQIGIDPQKSHSGNRSLRLLFQVQTKLDAINASQLVPVAPNTDYEFECYLSTAKLQGGTTPFIQILDPLDETSFADSRSAPSGTNDWTRVSLSFKTKPKTQAVLVKITQTRCDKETPLCPIFGMLWYDDFSLKSRN